MNDEPLIKENTPRLIPENLFPDDALRRSKQVEPSVTEGPWNGAESLLFTLATAADQFTEWGRDPRRRDKELREFWPTEAFMAGSVVNVSLRNSTYDWYIKSKSEKLSQAVTEMLRRAMSGDKFGWIEFMKKFSQDLYTTDNGAFIEIIRDEGVDANSKFKGAMAPVVGIAHLDSNQCIRTGNMQTPVIYEDRLGERHKLEWYQVIPFSDYPSAIEKMNGVGYCAITRILRLAQIMRSMQVLKDEMVGGRNSKDINVVSGVSRQDILDAVKRTQEQANNRGQLRYIDNVVLASLDPEKPVSVATIRLAAFPEGFDFSKEMEWYITGLALNFGTDYQDIAPLPGGNIGSSSQSEILSKKSSAKGPRSLMDSLVESFKNYGVLPRGAEMIFDDKNQQEESEKQNIRTAAMEEAAIAANAKIFPRKFIAEDLVNRGIYPEMKDIPEDFWKDEEPGTGQPVGNRSGNTIAEDAKRTKTGNSGGRLKKAIDGILGRN